MDPRSIGNQKLLEAVDVRPAGIDDFAHLRRLMIAAFQAFSSTEHSEEEAAALRAALENSELSEALRGQTLLIAWLDRMPVAVVGWRIADDSGRSARLSTIAVDPMFGALGLGRLMTGYVEQSARKAGYRDLVVHASCATEGFFLHLGFQSTAVSVKSIDATTQMRVTYVRKSLEAVPRTPNPLPASVQATHGTTAPPGPRASISPRPARQPVAAHPAGTETERRQAGGLPLPALGKVPH